MLPNQAEPPSVPLEPLRTVSAPTAPSVSASATAAIPTATSSATHPSSKPRQVSYEALAVWSKPGLCASSTESASAVRERITSSFRLWDAGAQGRFYVDPRLSSGAEQVVSSFVARAAREVGKRLGLHPPRPDVFIYFDQALLKASACINEDVVAFYDGVLHVVTNRADTQQSVLHEYTHHALFSSGVRAPAWAQEGIAMSIAQERWWRTATFLEALLSRPFDLADMDRSLPYKLTPTQAVAFYVQSAAMVECLLLDRRWQLKELFETLLSHTTADGVSYDFPELEPASLQRCVTRELAPISP